MISWTRWRVGLLVAAATGGLTALIGLGVGVTFKQAAYLLGISMGKDLLLYLTVPGYRDKVLSGLPEGDPTPLVPTPKQEPAGKAGTP